MRPTLHTPYKLTAYRNGITWRGVKGKEAVEGWAGELETSTQSVHFNFRNDSTEVEEYEIKWTYMMAGLKRSESVSIAIEPGQTACFEFDIDGLNVKVKEAQDET